MTYGIGNSEGIIGIEKISNVCQHFSWNEVKYLEYLNYCN